MSWIAPAGYASYSISFCHVGPRILGAEYVRVVGLLIHQWVRLTREKRRSSCLLGREPA